MAAYQAALRTVTYVNGSTAPSPLPRTVVWIVDPTAPVPQQPRHQHDRPVAAVNTPPLAFPDTGTTDEDTLLNVAAPGVLGDHNDLDLRGYPYRAAVNGVPGNVGTADHPGEWRGGQR